MARSSTGRTSTSSGRTSARTISTHGTSRPRGSSASLQDEKPLRLTPIPYLARIFDNIRSMVHRHAVSARLVVAIALVAALLPLSTARTVEAICPAPAAAMPAGCCGESAPPRCPSCPSEGRPSCPTPSPAGTRTCFSPAALPPGEAVQEARDARTDESASRSSETAASAPARSATAARRAAVTGSSPPARLLACTFRT